MSGSPVIGHRLGSIGNYDAFETVTLDGERWDILYFDMYHPRKSRRAPSGYALREPGPFAYATNLQLSDFPRQARQAIADWTRDNLGIALVGRDIAPALQSVAFQRPAAHAAMLSIFEPDGSMRRPPDPRHQLWIGYCEEQTKLLIALLSRRIGCKEIDADEIFFFAAATLLYAHSKYGVSSPNTNFVEQFQTSVVADCLKRTKDFGAARQQFHLRVREYRTLYDACFDQANTDADKGRWLITIMMHLVEHATHAPAKDFMISIASTAAVLAAVFDDAFQLVRKPTNGG